MTNTDDKEAICDLFEALNRIIINNKDKEKLDFIKDNLDTLFSLNFWCFSPRDNYLDIDGDNDALVIPIYWLLWGDKLKEIDNNYNYNNFYYSDNDEDLTTTNKYRGDTICTFNTIFSKASLRWFNRQNFSRDIEKSTIPDYLTILHPFTGEELKEINDFRLLYQSIGNFYILPNREKERTINFYRGNFNEWRDYFDLFLLNLDKELKGIGEEEMFHQIIKANDFFFGKGKIDSLDKFISFFSLEDFKNLNFEKHYYYNYCKDDMIQDYHDFALSYIRTSTKCINKRTEKLKQILKDKLKQI